MSAVESPSVGILPWGNVVEDFLEPTGMTLEQYAGEFVGSWVFAWARAFATAGVRPEIVCVSREASTEARMTHGPTGVPLVVLPTTRLYRAIEERGEGNERLLLIGGGSDSAAVDRIVSRLDLRQVTRVDRHIHDAGLLSRYLSAADAYVLSSRHEGFPVALIEAMSCGLPVIAADVAGAEEVLGRDGDAAGIVIPAGDPDAIADAVVALLGDAGLRERLGARGRTRAEEQFSLAAVGEQLRDLILLS